jgi:hypothetical protein
VLLDIAVETSAVVAAELLRQEMDKDGAVSLPILRLH